MLLGSPETDPCYYPRNLSLTFKAFPLEDVGVSLIIQSFVFLNRGNYSMVLFSFADLVFVAC